MTIRIQRALVSVSDKTGIENFARMLTQMGVELLSTGGTYKAISEAGITVREVSDYTGFPEMMNGRVKSLHPKIHGGILALRDNDEHVAAMGAHDISGIDLVVVNLYPFEETVAKSGVSRPDAVEQIDIGGPSMVRSAAKNHKFVGIVTDPSDYGRVLDAMEQNDGDLGMKLRRELAVKAFGLTARYDAAISRWMFDQEVAEDLAPGDFADSFSLAGVKQLEMRYGENPHQKAAFYRYTANCEPSVATAEVLNGKALSYNNIVDIDACLALAKEFAEPFVCVAKHNNPCGAAAAETIELALEQAWAGDPVSAFGSVLAFTRPVNLAAAVFLVDGNRFVEAIIAPSFDDDAFELLTTKPKWGKNVRLLSLGEFDAAGRDAADIELKKVVGGFLLQGRDLKAAADDELKVVTKTQPTSEQLDSLRFAEKVGKHVKSNAIVFVKGTRVTGVGAGQMSRVDSTYLAARKSGEEAQGTVMASDAFFPFPDGVETAMDAGVTAILQPGGSMRDQAVIDACDERNVPMVMTGARHFRH
ncbi:MAG: bifunctional phosphoribosylaminoimidazolecarboxamide formyltransferase/IMP cyclohydrolase [Planctomycetota bacterium]|nr:bifunctional phosphoribosylaminoimidazolecarboxamide formyltransferase/IMP cyclohydrolase [Planctomycetota bacterium]MDG2143241.1 bifunctional phosphoribosylaminoimidazolecarboxamide formyltransferase/IMP cyclohydrolase [Planctomycetota bacterium]